MALDLEGINNARKPHKIKQENEDDRYNDEKELFTCAAINAGFKSNGNNNNRYQRPNRYCHICENNSHNTNVCYFNNKPKSNCLFCGRQGHSANNCFSRMNQMAKQPKSSQNKGNYRVIRGQYNMSNNNNRIYDTRQKFSNGNNIRDNNVYRNVSVNRKTLKILALYCFHSIQTLDSYENSKLLSGCFKFPNLNI